MKRFFLFLTAALFLSACGDDTTGGFTAASGTIAQADAAANVGQLHNGAVISFTTPTGNPGAREDFLASCVTKDPVTPVDADSDQIKTQTRTYACTNAAGRAITYNQTGTAKTIDKDDADAKAGWRYEYDITGGHSEGETWTYKGFWDLTKSATSYAYSSDYKSTSVHTRSGTFVGGGTWNHTITPTDMASPYTAGGAVTFNGFYAYTFTIATVVTQYVFKMTSENLTYGAHGCGTFFNGGSYTYTDAGNNTIKVTHDPDCTTRTTTFNGTTI